MIRKKNSINTFRASNETAGQLWTQNFPVSTFQKKVCVVNACSMRVFVENH